MRHWLQLGTRNWRVRPGRTACALAAIALGVGVVVWVTCAYESVRRALEDQVWFWIGRAHLSVESVYGMYAVIPERIKEDVRADPNVAAVTARLKHGMVVLPLSAAASGPAATAPAAPPGVVAGRDSLRDQVFDLGHADALPLSAGRPVQAVGIEPAVESRFRTYNEQNVAGRLLRPEDTDAAIMDRELADLLGIKIGDRFILRNATTGADAPVKEREGILTLVGTLDLRRVAKRQKPVLVAPLPTIQAITGKSGPPSEITRVDMILKDPSPAALADTMRRLQEVVKNKYQGQPAAVSSSENKLRQVKAAERQTQFVLLLISTVALFTAFFVILSTLSMGMVERIGQLGMLRCLGMTRFQIGGLVLGEAVPLGLTGIVLGVPIGFAFARLSVWLAPEYIGRFAVSPGGLLLALGGGAATTLLGATVPMFQATRVSPLVALRSQARRPSIVPLLAAAALGVVLIVAHVLMLHYTPKQHWLTQPFKPVTAAALLYVGYALLAPALVLSAGMAAVRLTAWLLRIRHELLADQVGRAAWRSAAICCGLMVGLSLVVSIAVFSDSLASGWDFPRDFSEAYVYFSAPVPYARADAARRIGGVKKNGSALANEQLQCQIVGKALFDFGFTRFVAGDPSEFFGITRLHFVEGDKDEAVRKLEAGGHVLVTPEFVRAQRVGLGDSVRMVQGQGIAVPGLRPRSGREVTLTIAGVVTSPALDIAANYFNAGEALTVASAFVVLGTMNDLERFFQVPKAATLVLLNFDLPETAPPPLFAEASAPALAVADETARLIVGWRASLPERAEEIGALEAQIREAAAEGRTLAWNESPLLLLFRECLLGGVEWDRPGSAERRWRAFREELVMRLLARAAGERAEHYGSVAALKLQIDRDLRRATILFLSVPLVALIVAALGVGNLMMANVVSRSRQIAVLRAIGATREQVLRLVLGEALVLGILGSLLGLALGLHLATSLNTMTKTIWGYEPAFTIPDLVPAAIFFTIAVCLLAGLIPAARASRSNVIDAMQAT
ncbi:MAG: ABC transporter permease [Phycisphaerae bacterium]|jgi:putative ABC transport system permease protein